MDHSPRFANRLQALHSSAVRDLLADAQRPGMISLAGGLPDPALFDVDGIAGCTAAALAEDPQAALQYGRTEGQPRLQSALSALLRDRGIDTGGLPPLVTTGSQQAIDLLARVFLDPGSTVVIERPAYLAALQAFALCEARVAEVPVDAQGMQVQLLDDGRAAGARLLYVVGTFANPSGATLSRERKLALLRWAVRERVFVVEDDPYGELRFAGDAVPPMVALASEVPGAEHWCGYVSTLSKVLAPGLRVGFMVLPPAVRASVERCKQAMDLHTASLTQEVAARYLDSGRMPARIAAARERYRGKATVLAEALHAALGARLRFQMPEGGMFLWAALEPGIDAAQLLQAARERGVIFVPGAAFFASAPECNTMRLSFATGSAQALREGADRIAAALRAIGG